MEKKKRKEKQVESVYRKATIIRGLVVERCISSIKERK